MRINKKVEYALMSLKEMACLPAGELTSAREICDRFKIPFDTTAKVMQAMNSAGILCSVKGTKGGYLLARSLESISYMDLVRLIEGRESEHFCENSKGQCDLYHQCNISAPIEALNHKLNQFLDSLTLKELFAMNPEVQAESAHDPCQLLSSSLAREGYAK